jgi:nucleoside-diphosphate-sugar epimerase
MKILLIGATGILGCRIAAEASSGGHQVTGVTRSGPRIGTYRRGGDHLWRIADGRLAEHWDVGRPVDDIAADHIAA